MHEIQKQVGDGQIPLAMRQEGYGEGYNGKIDLQMNAFSSCRLRITYSPVKSRSIHPTTTAAILGRTSRSYGSATSAGGSYGTCFRTRACPEGTCAILKM